MWGKCGYFGLAFPERQAGGLAGPLLIAGCPGPRSIYLPGRAFIQFAITKAICQSALARSPSYAYTTHPPGIEESERSGAQLMGRQWHVKEGERVGRVHRRWKVERGLRGGEGDAINDGSSLTQILQLNLGHTAGSTRPPSRRMLCASSECQIDFLRIVTAREFVLFYDSFSADKQQTTVDVMTVAKSSLAWPASPTHPSIIPARRCRGQSNFPLSPPCSPRSLCAHDGLPAKSRQSLQMNIGIVATGSGLSPAPVSPANFTICT